MTAALPLAAVLRDAVRAIEASPHRIAVVVDEAGRLRGTLTDGDVRRGLLAGLSLESGVTAAMNRTPTVAEAAASEGYMLELLQNRNLEALPLVDAEGRFVRTVHRGEIDPAAPAGGGEGLWGAVIMAGGEGRRLRPLTEAVPKPMLEVGGMPLIERLVRSLARAGVRRVYISTHYLSHVIEDHLGDGSALGTAITYLREPCQLGTAGALGLLPERPSRPLLVLNGDVLTGSDCRTMLAFHREHAARVTVAAIEYRVEIPYGVLETAGSTVTAIREKPAQRFLCNAGLYIVEPAALDHVPAGSPFNMTDLIGRCLANGETVTLFPLHEYWADIGTPADLAKARAAVAAMDRLAHAGGTGDA